MLPLETTNHTAAVQNWLQLFYCCMCLCEWQKSSPKENAETSRYIFFFHVSLQLWCVYIAFKAHVIVLWLLRGSIHGSGALRREFCGPLWSTAIMRGPRFSVISMSYHVFWVNSILNKMVLAFLLHSQFLTREGHNLTQSQACLNLLKMMVQVSEVSTFKIPYLREPVNLSSET